MQPRFPPGYVPGEIHEVTAGSKELFLAWAEVNGIEGVEAVAETGLCQGKFTLRRPTLAGARTRAG